MLFYTYIKPLLREIHLPQSHWNGTYIDYQTQSSRLNKAQHYQDEPQYNVHW